jgi:hypothetical protein
MWKDLYYCTFGLEASVLDYEVLVLDEKANPRAFVEMRDSGDDDAVRSAMHVANGRPFEVWRDLRCIHRSIGTIAPQGLPIFRWKGICSVSARR